MKPCPDHDEDCRGMTTEQVLACRQHPTGGRCLVEPPIQDITPLNTTNKVAELADRAINAAKEIRRG